MSIDAFRATSIFCRNLLGFYPVLLQVMQLNCVVYSRHRSALGLIHLHSLGGSTFVFRYYSLGGDTAMPGRLYAVLCHAFLVNFHNVT